MNFRKPFAIGAILIAVVGSATAAMAYRSDSARDNLHRFDSLTRDLVPVYAQQFRELSNNRGSGYHYTRTPDAIRAIMALGRFEGQAHAFRELWDRYPNAPLGAALSDLDSSFQEADRWMRQTPVNGDVNDRWSNIRRAYINFQSDMNGAPWNRGNGNYYDRNGNNGYSNGDDYNNDNRSYGGARAPQIDIHQGR